VAAGFPSFPLLLETYRECLRDVFDLPALKETLREVERQGVKVHTVDAATPSPFAATLLFGFVANYLYEGDAPLAERRAQALAIDQAQLRELLGEAELRELLDPEALEEVERELQQMAPGFRARSVDGVHDLLRRLGDLSLEELGARTELVALEEAVGQLVRGRRAVVLSGAMPRCLAMEDVSRYRDALGIAPPAGLPSALLEPVPDPLGDLVARYARSHGPFTLDEVVRRYGVTRERVEPVARRLVLSGKLVEGAFRPQGQHRELCEPEVLNSIRRRSLARLRKAVEPVRPEVLGRFAPRWQGLSPRRRGLDAVLDAVERLQGVALPASVLESEILPARVDGYTTQDLDALAAAGELTWVGVEPLGDRDGRVALYLTDALPRLWSPPSADPRELSARQSVLLATLERGGHFFPALHAAAGGGYPQETVDALWGLVWRGEVTNDAWRPVRAFLRPRAGRDRRPSPGRVFRSRRQTPPDAEGRWSLVRDRAPSRPSPTEQATALARQLLHRYGLLTREAALAEALPGGFSNVYAVLRGLEETGRVRRGYFVSGVGAAQFAQPEALEMLRSIREPADAAETLTLSAVDPANPYGTVLPWPWRGPARVAGASVVLVDGVLAVYVGRSGRQLFVFLPSEEPERTRMGRAVAQALARLARDGLLVSEINGLAARGHPLAPFLQEAGFNASAQGFHLLRNPLDVTSPKESLLLDAPE
jgi:ATP-dependent Lhr-like helicase